MTALFLIVRYFDINEKYGIVDPYFDWSKQIPETLIALIIVTFIFAIIEPHITSRSLKKQNIYLAVLSKSAIYLCIIFFFYSILSFVENYTEHGFDFYIALDVYVQRLSGKRFQLIIVYMSFGMILIQFIRQISRMIGEKFFWNLVRGKYFRPKRENIILMFLDLKDSTSIAEKLGHISYSEFIQKFFYDISFPIKSNQGNIYQYVGDEIVIYWETEEGLDKNQCLQCFFDARNKIKTLKKEYEKEFGQIPEFKAGVHCGEIITAQVGNFKGEIAFHGDVINTVARIVAQCNELASDLLISGDLYQRVSDKNQYIFTEKGEYLLRGKSRPVELYDVSTTGTS